MKIAITGTGDEMGIASLGTSITLCMILTWLSGAKIKASFTIPCSNFRRDSKRIIDRDKSLKVSGKTKVTLSLSMD
jgi:hypothetical protein